jgi:CSLREA domain-containing protein
MSEKIGLFVMRTGVMGVTLAMALLGLCVTAPAALANTTISVNTVTDESTSGDGSCSLREAFAFVGGTAEPDCSSAASPSGTATIDVPAGHYFLSTGNALILSCGFGCTSSVVDGAGPGLTTIDAEQQAATLIVAGAATVNGLTITGGLSAPAGGIFNAGTLTLNGVTVTGNSTLPGPTGPNAGGHGGDGAGIYNTDTLTVVDSTISNNTTGAGGNGAADGINPGGRGGDGGGIYNSGTLTVTDSTIRGNTTGAGGTGGESGNDGSAGCASVGGPGGEGGGGAGIYNAGTLTMTGTTISGNATGSGGGGGAGDGDCTPFIADGGTGGTGGAGGGIDNSGTVTVTNATIASNATGGAGASGSACCGGSSGAGGSGGVGGGIAQSSGGGVLTNLTIALNATGAGAAGDGIDVSGGSFTEANTIVSADGCAGVITDGGHDLWFAGNGSVACPGASADPKLGQLRNNGGPTQTMALGAGSAARDALPASGAGCPTTDQRGVARPDAAGTQCDIGAYELAPPTITAVTAKSTDLTTGAVSANVIPNRQGTRVSLRYGTTTTYGSTAPAQDIGAGNSAVPVSFPLTGLAPDTTYHADVVAINADGASTSADVTFTTPSPTGHASIGSVAVSSHAVTVTISCSGGSPKTICDVIGSLVTIEHFRGHKLVSISRKRRHRKPLVVGSQVLTLTAGQTLKLVIPLNHRGSRLLRRFGKLPVRLVVTSGTITLVSQHFTMRAPRKHKRRKR